MTHTSTPGHQKRTTPALQQEEKDKYKVVRKIYRGLLPSNEDLSKATSFHWLEVPWAFQHYDAFSLPNFESELYASKSLAAVGIAPSHRGSAIFIHGQAPKQVLSRCKYATGLLLNVQWLRESIFAELQKLQTTTPHKNLFVGVLVMDRLTCTLATLEGEALKYVRAHARLVQRMLDRLHMSMLQAGFLQLDMKATNIGCAFSMDYQNMRLFMLDFNKVLPNVCVGKINKLSPAVKDEVFACIYHLTEGIVDSAAVLSRQDQSWMQRMISI